MDEHWKTHSQDKFAIVKMENEAGFLSNYSTK